MRVCGISLAPCAAAIVLSMGSLTLASERHVFEHEFVLGTSLQIQVEADSADAASAAEARVLDEIRRLEKIFSRYDESSQLSRWQVSASQPTPVSSELLGVLAACDRWQSLSNGAFNPAVQTAAKLWKDCAQQSREPSADELARVVEAIQQPQWTLDSDAGTATRLVNGPLTLDAIAKGTIVDRATAAAMTGFPEIHGVVINIGGDLRVAGEIVSPVQIADPFNAAVNAEPLDRVYAHNQGVATSGGYHRGVDVAGRRKSHIIDPRTAQPVDRFASVTVVADSAETADALATTFSVLPADESKAIAESTPGVEYLFVTNDGSRIASGGWDELRQPRLYRLVQATQAFASVEDPAPVEKKKSELFELNVKFELASVTEAQYRRSYVAIWLEDEDGYPVRTALLWITTKQPGPRWHRDLLRWYRNDRTRKLAEETDLIDVISEATRGPGQYSAVFDGLDNAGNPLKPGKYKLYLEAAREHGTYQLITHPLELGAEPIAETKLKSNAEFKSASVEYRRPVEPASESEAR